MAKILNLHGREMHRTTSLVLARSEFSKGSYNEKNVLAETEGHNGNWQEVLDIYNDINMSNLANTGPKQRETLMRISRCFYELGDDVNAIMVGLAARDMNPHFPGIHKATNTMNRAVLYEAPWDDTNTIEIREMFEELQSKEIHQRG